MLTNLFSSRAVSLVFVLLVIGVYCLWSGASDIISTAKEKSWPTVQGTVHAKDVWMRSGRHGSNDYIPSLRYYYELNGTAYTSETIRHGGLSTPSKTEAFAIISPYAVGMPTTVHYDPHNPSNAVLQVGTFIDGMRMLGLGLGTLLAGLLIGRTLINSNKF
jgi:hypothetical protein